ncbi:MAG: hypothetical protein ACNA71_07435, partial [Kiritimatiellia bacterium]
SEILCASTAPKRYPQTQMTNNRNPEPIYRVQMQKSEQICVSYYVSFWSQDFSIFQTFAEKQGKRKKLIKTNNTNKKGVFRIEKPL